MPLRWQSAKRGIVSRIPNDQDSVLIFKKLYRPLWRAPPCPQLAIRFRLKLSRSGARADCVPTARSRPGNQAAMTQSRPTSERSPKHVSTRWDPRKRFESSRILHADAPIEDSSAWPMGLTTIYFPILGQSLATHNSGCPKFTTESAKIFATSLLSAMKRRTQAIEQSKIFQSQDRIRKF